MRFKVRRVEVDWLEGGGQKGDWTKAIITAFSSAAHKNGSDVNNKVAAEHQGQQMSDSSLNSFC